jgi:hypothetical protein
MRIPLPLFAALLAACCLGSVTAPAAAQSARIDYTTTVFTDPAVTERHESNTRIVVQYWNGANELLATRVCAAPSLCTVLPPAGAARFAMALEYDSAREELVASGCDGVADTVPIGQCINQSLSVVMRVRFGIVRWSFVADARPGRPRAAPFGGSFGPTPKLEFADTSGVAGAPPKYWAPNKYNNRGAGVAAGVYDLRIDPMRGHCKPVHTNPGEQVRVIEGQTIDFTVRYTGTVCTLSIQSYSTRPNLPEDAGTYTSDPAGLSCGPNPAARTCKAEFPFDSTARLIANPAPGYDARFSRIFTGCSNDEADPRVCRILADGDRELSNHIYVAATTPPPPPPVGLAAAAGPAAPVDTSVSKGSNDVAMLQLLLTPSNGSARLQALTLQASGSGRDDLDLTEVRLYRDSNADGGVDPGEPLLARGRLAADNGSLRLVLATPLLLSEPTALVVVADVATTVNSAAVVGTTLGGGLSLALGAFVMRRRHPRRRQRGRTGGGPLLSPLSLPPVTYRVTVTAVEATDSASTPASITVTALPLAGAEISVAR